jgi:hypothetical protein
MAGLARIAKLDGGIEINSKKFVWDYVADKAVPEAEMQQGLERQKASERQRWTGTTEAEAAVVRPNENDERF